MQHHSHHELAEYLRCVIYDLFVMANATERMVKETDHALIEVYKTAALIKLRAVSKFLLGTGGDSIRRKWFRRYSPKYDTSSINWDAKWLKPKSIEKYVAHLDKERVTKGEPQPKFREGKIAILKTAISVIAVGQQFVNSIMQHDDFAGLNDWGTRWLKEFNESYTRLIAFTVADVYEET